MNKKINEIFMYCLGVLLTIGFFLLLILLILRPVPVQNSELLYLVVGALLGSFNHVVNFFFGSSVGSKHKTDLISKQNEVT
jgi:hypothetical protein